MAGIAWSQLAVRLTSREASELGRTVRGIDIEHDEDTQRWCPREERSRNRPTGLSSRDRTDAHCTGRCLTIAVACAVEVRPDRASPSADPTELSCRTLSSIRGDPRRARSQTVNRRHRPVCQNGIDAQPLTKRSGAAEGVGDGRRPAPTQVDHSGRRGPFSGLYSFERFVAAPACVRARPVVGFGSRPYRRPQSSIASTTRYCVHCRAITPGWQRLQYA
jgi:hypothetical protein